MEAVGGYGGPDDQRGRLIGRTKGGLNTKQHAMTDRKGRPLRVFLTAGQVTHYTGAAALWSNLPAAESLIAERRYDADWFRDALQDKGTGPLHPRPKVAQQDRPPRQAAIPAAQPHLDHVRRVEKLAQGRHPL